MANGQQQAEQNLAAFNAWAFSKTDQDFKEYIYRGKLKRNEIAAECCFGKSALVQNPSIKNALSELEDGLRSRGVLPPVKVATDEQPPVRDRQKIQLSRDSQRLNALEQQNAALTAKVGALEAKLTELNALDEFLAETGRMPR